MESAEFDPLQIEEWSIIIRDSLLPSDLRSLCDRIGIEFPGHRMKTVSTMDMAVALAEAMFDDQAPGREKIERRVAKANAQVLTALKAASEEEVVRMFREIREGTRDMGIGALLWAIRKDGRKDLQFFGDAIREIVLAATMLARDVRADLAEKPRPERPAKPRPEIPDSIPDDLAKTLHRLRSDVDGLIKRVAESLGQYAHEAGRRGELEGRVEEMKKEIAGRDEKLSRLRASAETAAARARQMEEELEAAKARKPAISEHEARKLAYERDQLAAEAERLRGAEERLRMLEAQARSRDGELLRRDEEIERLKKEVRDLRERAAKAAAPAPERPVQPPPPDPSRAAVLVDTQSLYFPAIRRSSRIDFKELLRVAVGSCRLARAVAYVVEVPGVNAGGFVRALRDMGYQVRLKSAPARESELAWTDGMVADLRDVARTCGRVVLATHNARLAETFASSQGTLVCFADEVPDALRAAAKEVVPMEGSLLTPMDPSGARK